MDLTADNLRARIDEMKLEQDLLSTKQKELSYQILLSKLTLRILDDNISIIDKSTGTVLSITDL